MTLYEHLYQNWINSKFAETDLKPVIDESGYWDMKTVIDPKSADIANFVPVMCVGYTLIQSENDGDIVIDAYVPIERVDKIPKTQPAVPGKE